MIQSQIVTVPREHGEVQRIHIVRADGWDTVRFFEPRPEPARAFGQLVTLYREYHITRYPWLYGRIVFFRLTDGILVPGSADGSSCDTRLALATSIFRKGLRIQRDGTPRFLTGEARALYEALTSEGCISVVRGKRVRTCIMPVADCCGFLSEGVPQSGIVANLSFFLMDPFDCANAFDFIGTPVGLRVRDGRILSPSQFDRPMLLVKRDGEVLITDHIADVRIDPLRYEINGQRIEHPHEHVRLIPPRRKGAETVTVVGNRVVAVSRRRYTTVPASGFTFSYTEGNGAQRIKPGDEVRLCGMSDVLFGVQVGPAAVIDGKAQREDPVHFYHVKRIVRNLLTLTAAYPPALFPCNPKRDRAPRMVLGADGDGKPMLLWFEGAAKRHHVPGRDSCGATLREAADFCVSAGMVNGVHLDGGGSAQILESGKRLLHVSDRDAQTGAERERAVPNGLFIG